MLVDAVHGHAQCLRLEVDTLQTCVAKSRGFAGLDAIVIGSGPDVSFSNANEAPLSGTAAGVAIEQQNLQTESSGASLHFRSF